MNKITKTFLILAVIFLCVTLLLFVIGVCFFDTNELYIFIVKVSMITLTTLASSFFVSYVIEELKK